MNKISLAAFSDEMEKIAGLRDLWQGFLDLFRSNNEKAQRKVDYHFSPKASSDRWGKLVANSGDPEFVKALAKHPDVDDKLLTHVKYMGELSKGKPMGKIKSTTSPGKTYEIRRLASGGYGCQCGDWRYKGSVSPGYECKHIRAFKGGN